MSEKENPATTYKSYDRIGVDERFGVQITKTQKGHRIETFSAYSDEKEYIYYVSFDDVPADVDWNEVINDYGTTLLQLVLEKIRVGAIRPYRTIVKDR